MTETSLPERHFARLARVPRATRQDWAARGLTSAQSAPYKWAALADVTCLRELRGRFELSDLEAIWRQVRVEVRGWQDSKEAVVLVDLMTLKVLWSPDADGVLAHLHSGDPVQLIDLAGALRRAQEGFALAASATGSRRDVSDELAASHQRRTAKRNNG
jgi:hypothetical protein